MTNELAPFKDKVAGVQTSIEVLARGVTLVTVRGELDLATSEAFDGMLTCLIGSLSSYTAIDVSGLEFCDSQGLTALTRADERARSFGGRVTLVKARPALKRLLRITGLADRLLPAKPPSRPNKESTPCWSEGR